MDFKELRNKIRYMIFKEQVTSVYVTDDLKVFGFKYRGISNESSLTITNQEDLDLTDNELKNKYGDGEIINLHFTDLPTNNIYIPKEFYDNNYEEFEKEILYRIEFEIQDSEIYNWPELHINDWNPRQMNKDLKVHYPSLNFTGTLEKLKMDYAIWYKES